MYVKCNLCTRIKQNPYSRKTRINPIKRSLTENMLNFFLGVLNRNSFIAVIMVNTLTLYDITKSNKIVRVTRQYIPVAFISKLNFYFWLLHFIILKLGIIIYILYYINYISSICI